MSLIKKYLKLSVLIAFGAFLTSCGQDTNLSLETQESVYLRFNTTPDPILTTRATGSVDDSVAESTTIKDLNVLSGTTSFHTISTTHPFLWPPCRLSPGIITSWQSEMQEKISEMQMYLRCTQRHLLSSISTPIIMPL